MALPAIARVASVAFRAATVSKMMGDGGSDFVGADGRRRNKEEGCEVCGYLGKTFSSSAHDRVCPSCHNSGK